MANENETKRLRVTHIPQVPMKGFEVEVMSEREAYLLCEVFANQHLFLYENNVIPDYSNAIIVEQWEDGEWQVFFDHKNGLEWDDFVAEFEDQLMNPPAP